MKLAFVSLQLRDDGDLNNATGHTMTRIRYYHLNSAGERDRTAIDGITRQTVSNCLRHMVTCHRCFEITVELAKLIKGTRYSRPVNVAEYVILYNYT